MMTREEAEKELIAMLEEAEGGPSYSMEEVDAYMRGCCIRKTRSI